MKSYKKVCSFILPALLSFTISNATQAQQAPPKKPECIAPAQPGGGFDLTCRIVVNGLAQSKLLAQPMRTVYMPGGIGAVAYNNVVTQRKKDFNAIVAFSSGSLLNLAQGKFGKYDESAVRWIATVGVDYGTVTVRDDSPYKDLPALMQALKQDPSKVILGAGGSIGSQDWLKVALTAQAAGVDYKKLRFVAFEGGGETVTALRGGHIQAYMGDAAEMVTLIEGGAPLRVLAVFNKERLPGKFANIPTAKEQGYDIEWPIIRGFYMGPEVSDAEYNWWVDTFQKLFKTPEFAKLQNQQGLFPYEKTGAELDAIVKETVQKYKTIADSFGLIKK